MAAIAKKNAVQLQVPVTLNPEAYQFLEKASKDGDLAGTLGGWCSYWTEQQARGGILLEPADHDYLSGLNDGKRFRDSRSLVRAVEKGLKRDNGQHSFQVNIDPAHYPALKENAEAAGLTIDESVDGIMTYIMSSGMIFDYSPATGRSIPFTFEMLQATAALCEKNKIDSTDVSGLIAEGRFLPVTRETATKAKSLTGKVDFNSADLANLFAELENARRELESLRKLPREVVAA